jgi:hypothetical protein
LKNGSWNIEHESAQRSPAFTQVMDLRLRAQHSQRLREIRGLA